MLSSEDKRLGVYFIKKSDLIYNYDEENSEIEAEKRLVAIKHNRYFAEKIIKYLWDDAFRFCRDIVFKMDTIVYGLLLVLALSSSFLATVLLQKRRTIIWKYKS